MPLKLNDARIFCEWDGETERPPFTGLGVQAIVRPDNSVQCKRVAVWYLGQERAWNTQKSRWSLCEKCVQFRDFVFLRTRYPINSNPLLKEIMAQLAPLVKLSRQYQRYRDELSKEQQSEMCRLQRKIVHEFKSRDIRWAEYLLDREEAAIKAARNNKFLQNIIGLYAKAQNDPSGEI